jgi:hypothetical protein
MGHRTECCRRNAVEVVRSSLVPISVWKTDVLCEALRGFVSLSDTFWESTTIIFFPELPSVYLSTIRKYRDTDFDSILWRIKMVVRFEDLTKT